MDGPLSPRFRVNVRYLELTLKRSDVPPPAEGSSAPAPTPTNASTSATAAATGSGSGSGLGSGGDKKNLQADADRLIAEGKKAIALKQWEEGVTKYADALDIM